MWGSFATDLAALRKLIMFTGGVLTENQKQLSSLHQREKKSSKIRKWRSQASFGSLMFWPIRPNNIGFFCLTVRNIYYDRPRASVSGKVRFK